MKTLMPNCVRHAGKWSGIYTHMQPSGETIDQYQVHILAEFPAEPNCDMRFSTHNVWPDGRETRGLYESVYRDGKLWFDGDIIGSMWEIDDFTSYLRFTFRRDRSIDVCEMLQISSNGQHRARTWHWFRDEKLFQITRTREWRPNE
jgi:hypothetical protein